MRNYLESLCCCDKRSSLLHLNLMKRATKNSTPPTKHTDPVRATTYIRSMLSIKTEKYIQIIASYDMIFFGSKTKKYMTVIKQTIVKEQKN